MRLIAIGAATLLLGAGLSVLLRKNLQRIWARRTAQFIATLGVRGAPVPTRHTAHAAGARLSRV